MTANKLTYAVADVARAALDYIDALPSNVVAMLPVMPGFDRDWAEEVLNRVTPQPVAVPDDLIMQIRRLVHALKNCNPDHGLVRSVPDYIKRMGYWNVGDCLRDAEAPQPVAVPEGKPSFGAMMRALDAFYADEDVPENAMLAAFKILVADVHAQAAQQQEVNFTETVGGQ